MAHRTSICLTVSALSISSLAKPCHASTSNPALNPLHPHWYSFEAVDSHWGGTHALHRPLCHMFLFLTIFKMRLLSFIFFKRMEEQETRPSVSSHPSGLKTQVHAGMWDAEREPHMEGCGSQGGTCTHVDTQNTCYKFRQPSSPCSHGGGGSTSSHTHALL